MSHTITLAAPHGLTARVEALPSTDAKNGFAQLIDRVTRLRKPVVITRNARPTVVVLSIEEYERLVTASPDPLAPLRDRFAALVGEMQTGSARGAVDTLFGASPQQLGAAAVKGAR